MEDEFQNFLQKVNEVGDIVKGLASTNSQDHERAIRKADLYLRSDDKEFDEDGIFTKLDKTVVNKSHINGSDGETMSAEAFMAITEKDAKKRAEDRRQRREIADSFKKQANAAFGEKDYAKALDLYNKAIDQVKDSGILYTNRATTLLKLGLYSRAVDDCEWALRVNRDNLRAWLLKAKAHHFLEQTEEKAECLREARERHPSSGNTITEYMESWNEH
ncbi:tetratricopeptide repeat protein 12-like [Schistocerca nitens]|uniref:tetratricopeptide repeat protein 12-like n=1 Tax=Schistocerca nitens TaxID=7011 RepID=UPI0021175A11|nr:tetratricopeptide repeat protein 12-like [Schistocerca nitens]